MSSNVLMTTVPVFAGVDFNIWADILLAWLQATGLSSVLSTDRPDDAEVSLVSPLTDEDTAAQAEAIMAAQKKQADWDEKNDKAMGSIKLRLSPPVRQKTFGMTTAKEIWVFLKKTYGKPGVSAIYTDFKRATSITIPNDANPSAAIELIRMHFDRVSAAGIPTDGTSATSITKVANFLIVMFIISKLPPRYEYLINQYTQCSIKQIDGQSLDELQYEIVNIWESRQGAFKGPSGKAQANRLSAVKRKDGNPTFQQQQQQRPSGSSSGANGASGSNGNNKGKGKGKGKGKANFRRGGRAGKFEQAKRQGQAHLVNDDMSPMMHTVTVVNTPAAIDTHADMACAQGEDASWNEDTLVNTSELGSVFGTTTTESGAKVSQDIQTPVPLIDRIAADPAAEMMECAIHLGERFQNPEDSLHLYGEPLRATLNTVAPTGTRGTPSLIQRLAAVRSEMPSGSQPAPPNGMITQSLPSSRVASPTPGTTSTGWEWLTPHLQNEDGRYDELIDWQRDATIGLGGMELPSRAPTPSSMPELRSMSPSLSETSDLEYMSTPPSIGRMSLPTSPVEDTASFGIPSPRPSTPVRVTVNAANNYGWSLDSEPSGLDNGYLSSS
ncbi:hypothetical protein D9758_017289 [Tetrapyrgos nigripes]|uniref:Gag protein n=1 Tax=Tetrapyrgos nigripes TaxID=182062 RepID=A0A8H5C4H9_9AGAR|nr:hypothetical protein D9758_017289 [Tetrapyrgos nigripes]